MIKFYLLCIAFFCIGDECYSQSIIGSVQDTSSDLRLSNAVIYLKKAENSKLVAYSRSGELGNFKLDHIDPSKYIMVVSYPGYIDWLDSVEVTDHTPVRIPVFLMTKAHFLEEVIVRQSVAPIRIKGDTTEFLADSFHVPPGANVEDLLRVLPGLSVNAKGQITVDGQRVQKVLVDGDEFFGNDPTLATQNLNKSDVAKIQVFDKKTDKAVITGVDDGIKEKTINVVLKEDAKKGYFGELSGGSDFNKYYQGKATISRFTNTLKFGALFLADRSGRDIDNGDFGSFERRRGGISEIIQGATMLNKKFGAMGSSTANNFSYTHLGNTGNVYNAVKYIFDDTSYFSNQYNTNKIALSEQTVNSQNTFKIDSITTLTANLKFTSSQGSSTTLSNGNVLAGDNSTFINTSFRSNISSSDNNNGKVNFFLKRVFDKAGAKFLTVGVEMLESNNNNQYFLYNKTDYYSGGTIYANQIIDQKKSNINKANSFQFLTSYVVPLSKSISANFNYTLNSSSSDQNISTFESRNGKYDSLNQSYSNHYKYLTLSHQGGASINFNRMKLTARAGFSLQSNILKQTNLYINSISSRTFVNVFPTAGFGWKFSKSGSLNMNYFGKIQQPTLLQLQPIENNDDPLNIQIGNPFLKPAFHHSFSLDFFSYKQIVGRYIRGGTGLTLIQNDFSSSSTIDGQGRRSYQTINIAGNYSYDVWLTYQRDLKFMNMNASIAPDFSNMRYVNFINGVRNVTNVYSFSPMLRINRPYTNDFPLDVQFQYLYQFNRSTSSVSSQFLARYNIQSINLFLTYGPQSGWLFTSYLLNNIRGKISPSDASTNSIVWNVSVEKRLSKKYNISGILKANDILNQNIGFNRSITSTSVSESTYNTIQRYLMLSLRWRFNKNRNSAN
jgi:hypothetical protein